MTGVERALAVVDGVGAVPWFSRVGGVEGGAGSKTVKSWREALAKVTAEPWEELQLELANQLRKRVNKVAPQRYQGWNGISGPVRARVGEIVEPPVRAFITEHKLAEKVWHQAQWDVMHAALEAAYSDIVPVGPYSKWLELYREGRFPCGWEGEYPKGVLLVF
jgi:hypothetical protein